MKAVTLFLVLLMAALTGCDDHQPTPINSNITDTNPYPYTPDPNAPQIGGLTGATPKGGPLKSAREGPERSIFGVPGIDINTFTLRVSGMVDSSLELTWPQILELPTATTDTMLMYCVEGWEVWGTWEGVLLDTLFSMAGIQPGAKYALLNTADGYSTSHEVAYLHKYNAMLAYKVNGEYLANNDGFPLRLICFGKFGYKWAKWVNDIELTNYNVLGFWEKNGYDDQALVPIERRIYFEGMNAEPIEY